MEVKDLPRPTEYSIPAPSLTPTTPIGQIAFGLFKGVSYGIHGTLSFDLSSMKSAVSGLELAGQGVGSLLKPIIDIAQLIIFLREDDVNH